MSQGESAGSTSQMNLKDFIRETLVQIASGVKEAQVEVSKLGGTVNPGGVTYDKESRRGRRVESSIPLTRSVQDVEIDVALTVSETGGKSGQFGLQVAAIGASLGGRKELGSSETSRVRVTIPVELPVGVPKE